MRRFRFSSWKFKLVMFVLITILFYDLGYYEPENRKTANKETTTSSGTPEEEKVEAIEVP
jgi:hypothetical protein